jgi:undecaprenyl diphosphate synthase
LPAALIAEIEATERVTAQGDRLWLRVAVDYSARDAILRAARLLDRETADRDGFAGLIARVDHGTPAGPVDLLIRSGGEQRLSDFLLWESAYAELYFSPRLWPDFGPEDLGLALQDYFGRERRFGGVPAATRHAGAA